MKADELLREVATELDESLTTRSDTLGVIQKITAFLADPPRCKNCRWWRQSEMVGVCRNDCGMRMPAPDDYCSEHEPTNTKDAPNGMDSSPYMRVPEPATISFPIEYDAEAIGKVFSAMSKKPLEVSVDGVVVGHLSEPEICGDTIKGKFMPVHHTKDEP